MRKQPRSNLLNALSDLHLLIFMATSDMLPLKVRLKEKNSVPSICVHIEEQCYILVLVCYSAHSPLRLFGGRLHQVLRLLLT